MTRIALIAWLAFLAGAAAAATWTADNGNGTFTNPLFYDEFSDPDLIRVGDQFYLTGTTMHAMPGLPILRSQDLMNWQFAGYVFDRLDLGPEFRLEDGKEIYGQGIWAPCLRYHDGVFHVFTNINRHTTQHFYARDPAGPWTRVAMQQSFHDLSVLFDDDGQAYVVWGYQNIQFARLNPELTDIVPGTQRTIIEKAAGMGEGLHFYKINGRYFITSAWFAERMRMACARGDHRDGPYEVNRAISIDEDFGLAEGNRLRGGFTPPLQVVPGNPDSRGHMSLHQGGIVATQTGEWWGFSMMDFNSVGRLTCLSPVTWQEGWPFLGLPGNLGRTPRTWLKPNTGHSAPPSAPYQRDDEFSGPKLNAIWQWNHLPDDAHWSLSERPGFLRLQALPAPDFWWARNTLTQRAIGPESIPTALLDASGLKPGDAAGLALLNLPYAWIAVRCETGGKSVEAFAQLTGKAVRVPLPGDRVWLRANCDYLRERAAFSYSTDGEAFHPLGDEVPLVFQLKTFQGVRYSLFAFNGRGVAGGQADFDSFRVMEPHPRGLMKPIPLGQTITLTAHDAGTTEPAAAGLLAGPSANSPTRFLVIDRRQGRVALRAADGRLVTVEPGKAQHPVGLTAGDDDRRTTFQWMENVYGDVMLLSIATDRFVHIDPASGRVDADHPGPAPDRHDGSCFDQTVVNP